MPIDFRSKEGKRHLLKKSKAFCPLPWMHLYAEPNGDVFPCCTATPLQEQEDDPTFARGSLVNNTIEEALNSPTFNKLRLDMLNGTELPSTCQRCTRFEEAGAASYRKFALGHFGKHIDLVDHTNEDGSLSKLELKFLNVRFSNHCNLACLTCGPSWSTAWYKHAWWLQRENKPNLIQLADNTKGNLWEQIRPHLHNIERIYFTGGEPIMMPDHWKILDYLTENNLQDQVELHYNTNLTKLKFGKYDLIDMWRKFKHVDIGISLDGVEKDVEIIRTGTKWEEVKQNMYVVRGLPNVRYQVDCVVSILNIYQLPKFEKLLLNEGLINDRTPISCNIAHEPLPLSITSIPQGEKKKIEDYLMQEYATLPPAMKARHRQSGWFQVINFMNNAHTYKKGELSQHLDMNLEFAREDVLETIPLMKLIYDLDNDPSTYSIFGSVATGYVSNE